MPGENAVKELVKKLSKFGILVSADIRPETLDGFEIDDIASRIIERRVSDPNFNLVNDANIEGIINEIGLEKAPKPIEIMQKPEFKALASEIDANYSVSNHEIEYSDGTVDSFVSHFKNRLQKLRSILGQHRSTLNGMILNLESLSEYSDGRQVALIGILSNKITTKKGNIMAVLEDETGEAKVMFMNGTSQQAKALFEKARHLVNDEVIAIKGKISGIFIIATEMVWPDVPIQQRKKVEDDLSIAFISDLHIGSRFFMEKNFSNFIRWTNGDYDEKKELASKLKYIVVGGDIVDGIGVYPNQDRELTILDIYMQYKTFFNYISMVPDYIHVFVIPGNHDAVQRAEPQPQLTSDLISDFKADNIHILPNPSNINIHGIQTLVYHGTSLDSVIRAIPDTTYAHPEKPMTEILKRRHLSPIWGGNIIVPSKNDNMVIEKIPDILHMGHIHKNCIANYHGVDIINSGAFQSTTDFQLMQGHIPTPCIVPVYETKANAYTSINFNK
jgi:DNA polymerase II small subunit